MDLFQLIESDYKKYKKYGGIFFVILSLTQVFWSIFQCHIASFIYEVILGIPAIRISDKGSEDYI